MIAMFLMSVRCICECNRDQITSLKFACLPERFEKSDSDGGGQVQAADVRVENGEAEAVFPVRAEEIFRQTSRFSAENEAIVVMKIPIGVDAIRFRGEIDEASVGQRCVECVEVAMACEVNFRPVVETRATQRAVVHTKSCNADDVQRRVGRGAEASDVTGVWWNLRFD